MQYNKKWKFLEHANGAFQPGYLVIQNPYPRLDCGFGYPMLVMNRTQFVEAGKMCVKI